MSTESAEGVSRAEFEARWLRHVADLTGLKWNLSDPERDELDKHLEALRDLVASAAENRGDR